MVGPPVWRYDLPLGIEAVPASPTAAAITFWLLTVSYLVSAMHDKPAGRMIYSASLSQ
jgi:hypothetical protein